MNPPITLPTEEVERIEREALTVYPKATAEKGVRNEWIDAVQVFQQERRQSYIAGAKAECLRARERENKYQEMFRLIGLHPKIEDWTARIAELEKQVADIACKCKQEDKHGETSIMCCNHCGKPTENFWTKVYG